MNILVSLLAVALVVALDSVVATNHQMDHNMGAMELGTADANLDLRFIDAMVLHHQGAILMARAASQKSSRPEVKRLAAQIIKAQEQEITQLQKWRKAWYPQASSTLMAWHSQMGHMMAMSKAQQVDMMMQVDLGNSDPNFDLRFINAMIPHHEGALVMAKEVQTKTKRSEIRQLAKAILSSQNAEINQMRSWKKLWYGG